MLRPVFTCYSTLLSMMLFNMFSELHKKATSYLLVSGQNQIMLQHIGCCWFTLTVFTFNLHIIVQTSDLSLFNKDKMVKGIIDSTKRFVQRKYSILSIASLTRVLSKFHNLYLTSGISFDMSIRSKVSSWRNIVISFQIN